MSTIRTPVGPQPPRVYWRRRLVLALAVLAVVIVVILIVVRPGGGTPSPAPSASPSPSASADAREQPEEGDDGVCRDKNVTIEAVTDKDAYAAGELPQLSMRLTNVGAEPCTLDVTPSTQVFEVGSGDEVYWLSSDCQQPAEKALVTLEPNVAQATAPLSWDRTRSLPCDTSSQPVPAADATYYLIVRLGELTSEKKPFRLL